MFIKVEPSGVVSLQDQDNFNDFYIVVDEGADVLEVKGKLPIVGSTIGNHYWLDTHKVAQLSHRSQDQDWLRKFLDMLHRVEKHGYYDSQKKLVNAHVSPDLL